MKFCPSCDTVYHRKIINNELQFVCTCGKIEKCDDINLRIFGEVFEDEIDLSEGIIKNSPFAPDSQYIKEDCDLCGRDYKALIIIGKNQKVIKKCKCEVD